MGDGADGWGDDGAKEAAPVCIFVLIEEEVTFIGSLGKQYCLLAAYRVIRVRALDIGDGRLDPAV